MELFDQVYEEHYHKLYTLAFRMSGNKQDAEDILQNAFLNAYRAYEDFRQESSLYTWLYRIVVNEANKYAAQINKLPVDRYAEEHGITSDEVYQYINSFGEVEDEVSATIARESCLQLFMKCMPAKYRVAFTLRVILQFSVKDTSEILEISEDAVKVNLHRARAMLKELMNGRCSLIDPNNPCKCSSWVKYAIETKQNILKDEIKVIQRIEKRTTNQFKREIGRLFSISDLYKTEITAERSLEAFKNHIKELIKQQNFRMLEVKQTF